MNLKDLEYFHHLVKLTSFTKVAQLLHVSQPTITYAVKRLEEELQTQLIIRDQTHHAIQITESGKLLDAHIAVVLNELKTARVKIHRLQNQKIVLGLPPIIGNHYFPKISVDLLQKKVMDQVTIVSGGSQDMLQLLKDGRVDMALIGSLNKIVHAHLVAKVLTSKPFMIVVSPRHPLAQKQSVSFAELTEENFVLFNEHYVHAVAFEQLSDQVSFQPKILYKTDDLNILKGMLKEQIGIGFLTEIALDQTDDLVAIPLSDSVQPRFYISLVQSENSLLTSIQEKIATTVETFAF